MTDEELKQLVADVSAATRAASGFDVTYVSYAKGNLILELSLLIGRNGSEGWTEGDKPMVAKDFTQAITLDVANNPDERPRIVELMTRSTTRGFNQWLVDNGIG